MHGVLMLLRARRRWHPPSGGSRWKNRALFHGTVSIRTSPGCRSGGEQLEATILGRFVDLAGNRHRGRHCEHLRERIAHLIGAHRLHLLEDLGPRAHTAEREQVLRRVFEAPVGPFLCMQASENHHALTRQNLSLSSGAYGATFFALTGLHGIHVMIGTTILIFILARALRGQFTPEHHFAFTAASWYWHFVGVLWLVLFVLVYCL